MSAINNYARLSFKQSTKSHFKYNSKLLASIALTASAGLLAYNYNNNRNNNNNNNNNNKNLFSKALFGLGASKAVDSENKFEANVRSANGQIENKEYYQKVYNAIAQKLIDVDDYDYGSYAPLLVRLAWHNSGSYDQNDNSELKGGSYAGTMRFKKEQADPENAGLVTGIEFLKSIKDEFPEISTGDLFTLSGVVGIQEMEGPKIAWRPGRKDLSTDYTPPYHRLPDASQTTGSYLRNVFHDRLGFNDEELVALIGVGHSIGRCHKQNSGFDGPWTFSPTVVSNQFFTLLLSEEWKFKKWDGKKQYEDEKTHSLMMLPADMALKTDSNLRKYVEIFAKDEEKCLNVFANAFSKLLERGIKFDTEKMYFKTLSEQED